MNGKSTNSIHPLLNKTTHEVLRLIHTNITGPVDPPGMNGEKYAQTPVNDYSGAIWVATMEARSGAGDATRN